MDFHPGTGVGDEGEADGVGFWESVQGEGAHGLDDVCDEFIRVVSFSHAKAESFAHAFHPFA